MTYRIYTEDKNRGAIVRYLTMWTDGFTLIPCFGYWKGVSEKSLIIEIRGSKLTQKDVEEISNDIKLYNNQKCVLISMQKSKEIFLGLEEE